MALGEGSRCLGRLTPELSDGTNALRSTSRSSDKLFLADGIFFSFSRPHR